MALHLADTAVAGLTLGSWAMTAKARRAGTQVFSYSGRRFVLSYLPPLAVGGLLTAALVHADAFWALPGTWLLLYGTGVVTGGAFSVRVVPLMGLCFMALGAIALLRTTELGNAADGRRVWRASHRVRSDHSTEVWWLSPIWLHESRETVGHSGCSASIRGATPARALELDRLIHERMRLAMVSALAVNETLSFNELKRLLETTDGNLSVHARKLEEAGYVTCTKSFEGRAPRTEYRLTAGGRHALERYLAPHGSAHSPHSRSVICSFF